MERSAAERLPGVFAVKKKNGDISYRASITYKGKHISLGSFKTEEEGAKAYRLARFLLFDYGIDNKIPEWLIHTGEEENIEQTELTHKLLREHTQPLTGKRALGVEDYENVGRAVSFDKWVMLINLRNSGIYCRNPIYLQNNYFLYYLDRHTQLKFDADDLFFYMNHKIMRRGGHLFVADYGMQVGILSRYGIRSFSVPGRDYIFINGDCSDYRYGNIKIVNKYMGVTAETVRGRVIYSARIHIRGDYLIGRYPTEKLAAAAYNKAVNVLREQGINKNYQENYIEDADEMEYAVLYHGVRINKKLLNITKVLRTENTKNGKMNSIR